MNVTTEITRTIYEETEGAHVIVSPDPDGLGLVRVRTNGKASQEFFGQFDVTFDAAFARQLGAAIIATADEIKD